MSWELAKLTTPVARRNYRCEASDWINNAGFGEIEYEPKDWEIIQQARREKNMILRGQQYVNVSGKWEGEFCVFRARKDLDDICHKYELYGDA